MIENEGKRYDRFRDRVMFPILNARGAVIGFGGRILDKGEPKYLNSPETPLFEKGRELYGLPQARDAIRAAARVLVVEGYMDVVGARPVRRRLRGRDARHRDHAGPRLEAAAPRRRARVLLRRRRRRAQGAWRALEVSLPLAPDHKPIRFLFLPEGEDPDTYVRKHGKDAFEARVREAETLSQFLLASCAPKSTCATPRARAFRSTRSPISRRSRRRPCACSS